MSRTPSHPSLNVADQAALDVHVTKQDFVLSLPPCIFYAATIKVSRP